MEIEMTTPTKVTPVTESAPVEFTPIRPTSTYHNPEMVSVVAPSGVELPATEKAHVFNVLVRSRDSKMFLESLTFVCNMTADSDGKNDGDSYVMTYTRTGDKYSVTRSALFAMKSESVKVESAKSELDKLSAAYGTKFPAVELPALESANGKAPRGKKVTVANKY